MLLGQVEQPARGHGVSANGVDTVCGHLRKIDRRNGRVELIPRLVRSERPVGNAPEIEFFLSDKHELAAGSRTHATDASFCAGGSSSGHTAKLLAISGRLSLAVQAISSDNRNSGSSRCSTPRSVLALPVSATYRTTSKS